MTTEANRWEHGSFHHWPDYEPASTDVPWEKGVLLRSGRGCLVALCAQEGWSRLWLPEYFCQHVTADLRHSGLPLRTYPDSPLHDGRREALSLAENGDAVLVVNTLGLRGRIELEAKPGVTIVEDHTHDPLSIWARTSEADFAFASLRKTVPLPIGGALWSPRSLALPPIRTGGVRGASAGLSSMLLKRLYLQGHDVDKSVFLDGFAEHEESLNGEGAVTAPPWLVALASTFPWERWRQAREVNFHDLASRLESLGLEVLQPDAGATPFALAFVAESPAEAERLRSGLIERSIFPPRLWDLDQPAVAVSEEVQALSRRLLVLHCDQRYGGADQARVAAALAEILAE